MVDQNKICYIFDVDGTLTEPRQHIDLSFQKEFREWAKNRQLFIATGSDFEKTKQQVPKLYFLVLKEFFVVWAMKLEIIMEKY